MPFAAATRPDRSGDLRKCQCDNPSPDRGHSWLGHPITINSFAAVKDNATFHSLDGTSVMVGSNARVGAHAVIHGGVNRASQGTVTAIGDSVTIGHECHIDSSMIPDGTVTPDRTILVRNVNRGLIAW